MEKMIIEFDPVTEEYTIVDGDHNLYSGLELIKIGADIVQEYVTCKKTDGTFADALMNIVLDLGGYYHV